MTLPGDHAGLRTPPATVSTSTFSDPWPGAAALWPAEADSRQVEAGSWPGGTGAVAALAGALRRADTAQDRLHVRYGLPGKTSRTWWRCADVLADPDRFTEWGNGLAGWLTARYGEAPERVVSGYLLSWYLAVPGRLAALLFHTQRRVPSLRPEDLAFRMGVERPHPDGVAMLTSALTPAFACLPDDPAAGTAAATVVADEPALAALLRARYAGHAARFVAAFGPRVRFGRRTLWAAATDALDEALWSAGRYCGDEAAGVADATLVLAGAEHPFTAPSALRRSTGADGGCWTRRRESCCFHYVLTRGQGPCETCPRHALQSGDPEPA
jgi:hypothetical protein